MTRVIADDGLRARLKDCVESLEICDESGQLLGTFQPAADLERSACEWADAQVTPEELDRARRDPARHTTAEILEYLKGL